MRLQHNESRLPDPLGLTAADELIDYTLRRIVEVAKLRFPAYQRIRIRHRVAQFKSYIQSNRKNIISVDK